MLKTYKNKQAAIEDLAETLIETESEKEIARMLALAWLTTTLHTRRNGDGTFTVFNCEKITDDSFRVVPV